RLCLRSVHHCVGSWPSVPWAYLFLWWLLDRLKRLAAPIRRQLAVIRAPSRENQALLIILCHRLGNQICDPCREGRHHHHHWRSASNGEKWKKRSPRVR